MKKIIFASLSLILFLVVFSYSNYERIDYESVHKISLVDSDIERAIIDYSASESNFNLKDDVAKGIYWSRRKPSEKPFFYSICYLHGFSASRKELSPIIEMVGDSLGAPVVFTRLEGHGLKDYKGMAKASISGWYRDAKECFDMASKVGEKVVLIGTSTGATLATLLASHYKEPYKMIFLSPNFKLKSKAFPLLSGTFGRILGRVVVGKEREIPHIYNEDFRYYWTTRYSSKVLSTLADLMRNLDYRDFIKIKAPLLIVSSRHDKIVDLKEIKKYANANRPGPTLWENREELKNHNLAGDIVDPSNNQLLVEIISNYIPAQ